MCYLFNLAQVGLQVHKQMKSKNIKDLNAASQCLTVHQHLGREAPNTHSPEEADERSITVKDLINDS